MIKQNRIKKPGQCNVIFISWIFFVVVISGKQVWCQNQPFVVNRPDAAYEAVLTERHIERKVTSFYQGLYGNPKNFTDEMWAEEQRHFLMESVTAGIDGPFALDAISKLGEPLMNELFNKYGMKFPIMAPLQQYSDTAKKEGAVFLFARVYDSWERGSGRLLGYAFYRGGKDRYRTMAQ